MRRLQKLLRLSIFIWPLALQGCTPEPGEHWSRVGSIDNGFIQFVQLDAVGVKDRAAYDDAVAKVCPGNNCFQVGIFGPSDTVPPDGSRQDFFSAGGWSNYHPLATYAAGKDPEYTQWDCARAAADAPLNELCGTGMRETFDAMADIGGRDGWTVGCGLPPYNGKAVVDQFLATVKRSDERAMYQTQYNDFVASGSSGPDDLGACKTLRAKMVDRANRSRAYLEKLIAERGS